MGADGFIIIMDVEKFIADKNLSEKRFESFLELILGSTTYLRKFKGERVITDYVDDNIYTNSVLQELSLHGFDRDEWGKWTYDSLINRLGKYEFTVKEFLHLGNHLLQNCYIDTWEVWT